MKLSKFMHIGSIVLGFSGIVTALVGIKAGTTQLIWGLTREHLLLCSGLLMLMAIWAAISTIHHIMLEKTGEWL